MLFIIIHQTFELWFKQVLHELNAVTAMFLQDYLKESETTRVLHHLNRVVAILRLAVSQFDVLETLTPCDFMVCYFFFFFFLFLFCSDQGFVLGEQAFRDYLYPASGFQSYQFRLLENLLGVDSSRRIQYQNSAYHTHLSAEHQKVVLEAEKGPNLLQCIERWLERTPFVQLPNFDFLGEYRRAVESMYDHDAELLANAFDVSSEHYKAELAKNRDNKRDFLALFDEEQHKELQSRGIKTLSFKATQAALLITLYSEQPQLHVPYLVLQRMVDIDLLLAQWRYRHALIVSRMIGSKLGTGGSSGYGYLRSVIEPTRVFRDIANLATYIIRPTSVPPLPDDVVYQLSYVSEVMKKK